MTATGNPKENTREASQGWFYPVTTKLCKICWKKVFLLCYSGKFFKENLCSTQPHVFLMHQKQRGLVCVPHLAVEH